MKYYGQITDQKDIVNKGYVDNVLPKDYELIETIDITEDTSSVERSVEPDGTEYSFSALFAIINFPAKTSDYDTVCVKMNVYKDKNTSAPIFQETIVSKNEPLSQYASHNWLPIGVLNIKGIQIPYIGKITTNRYYGYPATLLSYPKFNEIIKKVTIHETYKQFFIAGTKIDIYGVRA